MLDVSSLKGISSKSFGFIGAGKMAEAIFSGLLKSGKVQASNIKISDVSKVRLLDMQEKYGVCTAISKADNSEFLETVMSTDIILLAVKPQNARELLRDIGGMFKKDQLVVSIMGGVALDFIEGFIENAPVVRVMPNAAMLVCEGASGVATGKLATEEDGRLVVEIFNQVGTAYLCPEYQIDPVTSVSGCGPAFAYMFIEALADGGVEQGLPRDLAYKLAAQTLVGAGKMVLETGRHPGQLKDDVCSPGGSTIAGVHMLERMGLRGAVMDAVEAAKKRMQEVGKNA